MAGKLHKNSNIMQHNGKQNILEDFTKLMKIQRYAFFSIRSHKFQEVLSEIL
jgi:hypothetical protein